MMKKLAVAALATLAIAACDHMPYHCTDTQGQQLCTSERSSDIRPCRDCLPLKTSGYSQDPKNSSSEASYDAYDENYDYRTQSRRYR